MYQAIMLLVGVWLGAWAGGVATEPLYAAEPNINALYLQQLLRNMNADVEPCEDFYEYACGNWAQNYDSSEYLDAPGFMDHQVNKQLLAAIDSHRNERGIYAQLWTYYAACTNLTASALNGFLWWVQQELQFEWPIFRADWPRPSATKTQFDWLAVVAGLRVYGLNGVLLTQSINTRPTNGSYYLIELHGHQLHSPLQQKSVEEILVNFGMTPTQSQNVADEIVALELVLEHLSRLKAGQPAEAKDTIEEVEELNVTRLEMNVTDLQHRVPQIDWHRYMEKSLPDALKMDTLTLLVLEPSLKYFRRLPTVLRSVSNETLAYYVMLKFMYELNKDLPTAADKSERCIQHLRGYMPLAVNYVYAHHFYQAHQYATDTALHAMYNKLRANFEKLIAENHLKLDKSEIAFVLDELNSMQLQIGLLPALKHPQQLKVFVDDYYADIRLNATDFYHNHLQLIRLSIRHQQRKLANTPTSLAQLAVFAQDPETAASSSPVKVFSNAIVVPYGYLQLPFFHHQLHPLFRYSLLGFMLAHEIMHAYDLFHVVYDQHGNYNTNGVAVAQHFWPYINCVGQSQLTSVLSENMADVAGLRLAYRTYFDEAAPSATDDDDDDDDDDDLVTGNFTSEQLFFINSVQFLCANMRKIGDMNVDAASLRHDMHDVRVLRNWPNFEQFAAAFRCDNDSKMNPPKKCRLW